MTIGAGARAQERLFIPQPGMQFTTAFTKMRLTNLSASVVVVDLSPLTAPFLLTALSGARLRPGESMPLDVHFTPIDGLLHLTRLTASSSNGCSVEVPVRGLGAGFLSVSADALDFGNLEPGTSKTSRVQLNNTRRTPLTFSAPELLGRGVDGGGVEAFTVSGPLPLTLPPASLTVLEVTARPPSYGRFIARLSAQSASTRFDVQLHVTGGAPVARLSPNPLELPLVGFFPGSNPPSFIGRFVTLENLGNDAGAPFSALQFEPPFFKVESLDGGSPADVRPDTDLFFGGVAPGASALLRLSLLPQAPGPRTYRITFFTNDAQQPLQVLEVNANVVVLPPCSMQIVPPDLLDLRPAPGGGLRGTVTFTNQGTTRCVLDDVRLEAHEPGFFIVDGGVTQLELAPSQRHVVMLAGPDAGPTSFLGVLGYHVFNPGSFRQGLQLRHLP